MNLLVVGHSYMLAHNQKKYVAMKRLDPGLRLRIVGPKHVTDFRGRHEYEIHAELSREEVSPLPSAFSGSHMTFVPGPAQLVGTLRTFRPDVIHVEEEPHSASSVMVAALNGAIPPAAALTIFTWDNLVRRRPFPLGAIKQTLRAYTLRRAAAVVCGNRDAERILRERLAFSGPVTVLPQFGLDSADHAPGSEPELKNRLGLSEGIILGHVGRLEPEKGVEDLLRALAELPSHPWKLLLVGSGSLQKEIEKEWMPRFPGRIVHVPAVPHLDVPRYLRCLDIFVLPSYATPAWKEQFGLTLAQAMMLGIPSVASSSGAIPEVAGPGALIFEERSEEQLRDALEALFWGDALRREIGARAKEFALQRYTHSAVAARYLTIFEQARSQDAAAGTRSARSLVTKSRWPCEPQKEEQK